MKLLERDNIVLLPRFVLGLGKGVANVYLKPAVADLGAKALNRLNLGIPSMEVINAHISEIAAEEFGDGAI